MLGRQAIIHRDDAQIAFGRNHAAKPVMRIQAPDDKTAAALDRAAEALAESYTNLLSLPAPKNRPHRRPGSGKSG